MSRRLIVRIPTRREAQRRILALVGLIASAQLVIDSLDPFFGRYVMLGVRVVGAAAVASAAIRFEMYKGRRAPS